MVDWKVGRGREVGQKNECDVMRRQERVLSETMESTTLDEEWRIPPWRSIQWSFARIVNVMPPSDAMLYMQLKQSAPVRSNAGQIEKRSYTSTKPSPAFVRAAHSGR